MRCRLANTHKWSELLMISRKSRTRLCCYFSLPRLLLFRLLNSDLSNLTVYWTKIPRLSLWKYILTLFAFLGITMLVSRDFQRLTRTRNACDTALAVEIGQALCALSSGAFSLLTIVLRNTKTASFTELGVRATSCQECIR